MFYSGDNRIYKKTFKQNDLYFLETYLCYLHLIYSKKSAVKFYSSAESRSSTHQESFDLFIKVV